MNKKIKKTGFTLVELLVVIAIISILTIISVSSFRNAQIKARDAQRKSDLEQVSKALMLYYSDTGTFPASFNFGNENPGFVVSGTIYMRKTPQDPKSPSSVYIYKTNGKAFKLFANLESKKDSQCSGGYWPSGSVGVGISYCYGVASPNTTLQLSW